MTIHVPLLHRGCGLTCGTDHVAALAHLPAGRQVYHIYTFVNHDTHENPRSIIASRH